MRVLLYYVKGDWVCNVTTLTVLVKEADEAIWRAGNPERVRVTMCGCIYFRGGEVGEVVVHSPRPNLWLACCLYTSCG